MATFTTRLNATKPASSENVDVTVLNNDFDLFDAAVGSSVGTLAARPASAFQGRLYYTTDGGRMYVNSASSASTAASWQDAVNNALAASVNVGGDVAASGALNVARSASSSNAVTATVYADSQKRWAVTAGGVVNWGSGSGAADVNLYRSAADILRTDDSLLVGGGVTSVGTLTASTTLNVGAAATLNGGLTVTGKGERTYVRKSASESVISLTAPQADNHITFTLAASAVYELRCYLAVSGPVAADFKTTWGFTGAASGGNHTARYCLGPSTSVGSGAANDTVMRSTRTNLTTSATYGTDGTLVSAIYETCLLDTAPGSGTITLQWAQNSSTATSTVVSTDSWAVLERLV